MEETLTQKQKHEISSAIARRNRKVKELTLRGRKTTSATEKKYIAEEWCRIHSAFASEVEEIRRNSNIPTFLY
ncbi:MAG: hypothetical protein WCX30_01135 [Candidatus Paceibacterota bacterium]|jgi:hypothetical protein|nr:hypothetical protein [bacterium]